MHFDMKGKIIITNGKVLYYIFHQAHAIYTCACSENSGNVKLSFSENQIYELRNNFIIS